MPSGLFGPGRSTGQHTRAELERRQSAARIEDANASAHPGKVTLEEIKRR